MIRTAIVSSFLSMLFVNSQVLAAPTGWSVTSDGNEVLYRIDLPTGTATAVGTGVGIADAEGLSFDPTSGILYGIDDSSDSLISINTTTGVGTTIGATGVNGTINPGLAIDASGNAFMADQDGNDIYSVNLGNGAASLVGNTGLGDNGIDGLAFIGTTLYGVAPNTDTLYTINTTDGSVTAVGAGLGVDIVQESGLAYDGTDLWAVDDSGDIFRINPNTGVGTFIVSTDPLLFEGLAIMPIPEPMALCLATIGLVGLCCHRRQ